MSDNAELEALESQLYAIQSRIAELTADVDLFSDDFVSARKRKYNSIEAIEAAASDDTDDKQSKRWRKGTRKQGKRKTPEKNVIERIERHLREQYGARVLRTNAGWIKTEDGDTVFLGEVGRSDLHACIPLSIRGYVLGLFAAIECKAGTNSTTPAQDKYLASIAARGGIYIIARTVLDLDEAIAARRAELERWIESLA